MSNILGEPINSKIQRQIALRQKYYGEPTNNGTSDENEKLKNLRIQLNQQQSPFIRLSSSVNIDDEALLRKSGLPSGATGNALAKGFVLFNGSSAFLGNTFLERGGLNRDENFFGGKNAYGVGGAGSRFTGVDFGQVPMPGIKDIQVQYKNRGSLRQASISLTAYNITQFNAIDLLYLRLGYTVLLEWGNNVYIDNDEELVTQTTPTYYQKFIEGKLDYYQLLEEIDKQRRTTDGNYDAMIGKITNFNWNFNPDGSYEISINLVSIGDVIESIKANTISYSVVGSAYENKLEQLTGTVESLEKTAQDYYDQAITYQGYQSQAALEQAQQYTNITGLKIEQSLINSQGNPNVPDILNYDFVIAEDGTALFPGDPGYDARKAELDAQYPERNQNESSNQRLRDIATPESPLGIAAKELQDFLDKKVDQNLDSKGYLLASSVLSNIGSVLNKEIKSIGVKGNPWYYGTPGKDTLGYGEGRDYAKLKFTGVNKGSEDEDGIFDDEYYVRLGYLLYLLEKYVVFRYVNSDKEFPSLKFYRDENSNFIPINASTFPADPRICIFDTGEINFYGTPYRLYTGTRKGEVFRILKKFVKKVSTSPSSYVGHVMNTYINVKYVLQKVNEGNQNENGCSVFDLLKHICDGINKNLGGINKLEPILDDTTNIVYLIDQSPIAKDTLEKLGYTLNFDPTKTAKFQIYGLNPLTDGGYEGSFVKNFNIKTEISPKLATQLSIGAQAIGATVSENATGLQWFNSGITDRISPKKVDSLSLSQEAESTGITTALNTKLENQKELAKSILDNVVSRTVTPSQLQQLISLNKTFQGLLSTEISSKTQSPTPQGTGFIPINLSLTMDGLSGIKIYNTFAVNSKFLPPNYGDNLLFITTKLNHKIDSSGWESTLESLVIPSSVGNQSDDSLIQTGTEDDKKYKPKRNNGGSNQGSWKGTEPQFRDIVVTSIILHITVGNNTAQGTVDYVGKIGSQDYDTNGIHYAVDRTGTTAAGIPEGKHAAHANEWKDYSIGIEIASYGYVVPFTLDDGTIEYATVYDKRVDSDREKKRTIPADQVIQLKADDGKPWKWMGHEYFQEYTDVQIAALKTLIEGILSRHDGVKPIAINGLTSAPIKDGIKGSVWSVFGMTERPKSGKDYNRSTLSIPPNKAAGKSWDQLGIFTHTTAKTTDHTDPIPTPKLINMLLSLGYKDEEPA